MNKWNVGMFTQSNEIWKIYYYKHIYFWFCSARLFAAANHTLHLISFDWWVHIACYAANFLVLPTFDREKWNAINSYCTKIKLKSIPITISIEANFQMHSLFHLKLQAASAAAVVATVVVSKHRQSDCLFVCSCQLHTLFVVKRVDFLTIWLINTYRHIRLSWQMLIDICFVSKWLR